jgi:hypothetical protein
MEDHIGKEGGREGGTEGELYLCFFPSFASQGQEPFFPSQVHELHGGFLSGGGREGGREGGKEGGRDKQ